MLDLITEIAPRHVAPNNRELQIADFFPDKNVLWKYKQLGWQFQLEKWRGKDDVIQANLQFKSPRMQRMEDTFADTLSERELLDEEAWMVARRFMDDNAMFVCQLRQKMTDIFRKNKKIEQPDNLMVEINFNYCPQVNLLPLP